MPDKVPEHIAKDMPGRMPEDMPDRMPEDMPDKMPEGMSDGMPEGLPVTKRIDVMVGITRSKVIYFNDFNGETTRVGSYIMFGSSGEKPPCG
jgi:hypothetical protein